MSTGRLLITAGITICLLSYWCLSNVAAQRQSEEEVIRVDTDVTNLFFTVTDKQRRFVTSLQASDVQVLEDGAPQKPLIFQRETDRPLSIALLIDVSASEEVTLADEKAAARSFIETIISNKDDEAAIIPFTDRAFLEQPFTGNRLNLYRVLGQIDVAMPTYVGSGEPIAAPSAPRTAIPLPGTTAIWDAVTATCDEVIAPRVGSRRRAIILLTDGRDTSSRTRKPLAIERAIAAETVIYAIGIGDSKRYEGVDKGPLKNIAEATGGRAFFPKKEPDLKNAFAEIEQELRSQYLVAYSSTNKNRDGSFRKIKIELTNPELQKEELQFRHRPGYFAKRLRASVP